MATEGRQGRGNARAAGRAEAAAWGDGVGGRLTSPGAFRAVLASWPASLAGAARHEVENRRLFPWIAVSFGLGILLAFAADGPLSAWPPLVAGALATTVATAGRARLVVVATFVALAAVFFGFAATALRMRAVEAPILQRLAVSPLEGFVETIEERPSGGRLVIRVAKLDKVAADERPPRIRVTVRTLAQVAPGDYVRGTVRLLPLPEAARPGGYDFARDAYFRRLGAVGSVSGRLTRMDPAPIAPDLSLRAAALVDAARNALTTRIAGTIGGQAGAVAAALITGKRGLIDERTNEVLRAAGIYHVVSISGLHMVLAAGTLFWLARALMALVPALALGWPIKKLAALVGMAGATAYCVFSGSEVATERALIMILIMQGAILFDRPALTLRNLAISALLVLAREPESLLGPSFQMSYAAVAGLIAVAEWHRGRRKPAEPGDAWRRVARWLGAAALGVLATTLTATIATGPFGAYHFQNLQPYGLIGNAATLPLISLAVMPAAVLGVLAYPFGLDRPVWTAMGWAVDAVLSLSGAVAGLGGSTVVVPAFGAGTLTLFALAILCATLFASGLRALALAPLALGAVSLNAGPNRPDILVARDGLGAAVRVGDGGLALVGRVQAFTDEQWLKADGDARKPDDPSLRVGARCDRLGCVVELAPGRWLSYVSDRRAFSEDCRRADVVISRLSAPVGCAARTVIDRAFLAGHGATALRLGPSGAVADTVRRPGEGRPWLVRQERAPRLPLADPFADARSGRPRATDRSRSGHEPRTTRERPTSSEPPAEAGDLTPLDGPDGDPYP